VINLTAEEFLEEVQKYFPGAKIVEVRKVPTFDYDETRNLTGDDTMTTLNFTVAEVRDPYGNRKTGTIKTSTDQWISIWPTDKHLFEVGASYSALCDARDYQGKTYYTVKSPSKGGNVQRTGGAAASAPAHVANVSQPVGISKDDTITRIAIAKSCIEAHESMQAADAWYAWVMREEIPDGVPTTNVGAAGSDLDDEIPF